MDLFRRWILGQTDNKEEAEDVDMTDTDDQIDEDSAEERSYSQFLKHSRPVNLMNEPVTKGFISLTPTKKRRASSPTPSTPIKIEHDSGLARMDDLKEGYDVDEKGCVLGMIWPYTDRPYNEAGKKFSLFSDEYSLGPSETNGFAAFPEGYQPDVDRPPVPQGPTPILFATAAKARASKGDQAEMVPQWRKNFDRSDPKVYNQLVSTFTDDLAKLDKKRNRRAKRTRFNPMATFRNLFPSL